MSRRLLVCDLDNTLYDWVGYFVPAFYSMVDEAVRIIGCDRETLLDEFRIVHRANHDSEHPFALLDTPSVQERFRGKTRQDIALELNPAFHAFNSSRKSNLRLYPGVRQTLDTLAAAGIILVAHTESKLYGAVDRLGRLEISDYFRRIYCRERPDSVHPDPAVGKGWLAKFPMHKVVELSHHQRKPDRAVLEEICRAEGIDVSQSAYVGDSMAKDIAMAKAARVFSIWAKYGAHHDGESYSRLVRVTHWTEDDVKREHELQEMARTIMPDYVLEHGFDEIIEVMTPQAIRLVAR